MKLSSLLVLLVGQISSLALAQGNYKLTCDDNNIFETPLVIEMKNTSAEVHGNFSGPGDAIFEVHLKNVQIENLELSSDQKQIEHVNFVGKHLSLSLQANGKNQLFGHIKMVSTDSEHMPYSGPVVCESTEI